VYVARDSREREKMFGLEGAPEVSSMKLQAAITSAVLNIMSAESAVVKTDFDRET
jgi:hypothetical protein